MPHCKESCYTHLWSSGKDPATQRGCVTYLIPHSICLSKKQNSDSRTLQFTWLTELSTPISLSNTQTHTHTNTLMHIHSHHTHTYAFSHTRTHMYKHTLTLNTYTHTHIYSYTFTHTHLHTYVHTNTHIHTHTHILSCKLTLSHTRVKLKSCHKKFGRKNCKRHEMIVFV